MQAPLFNRLLAFGALLITASSAIAQSSLLDALPAETQDSIKQVCLPVQFREGANAYRNCVKAEMDLYSGGSSTALGQLSFDDKYAVQQACAKAGGQSSNGYRACISNQIGELNAIDAPSFEQVSEDELYVIQQTCFDAQSKGGAAKYRSCLNNEINSLANIPIADTSNLDAIQKNTLELRCSARAATAAAYRQCIGNEYASVAGASSPTDARSEARGEANNPAVADVEPIPAPRTVDQTVAQNVEPAVEQPIEQPVQQASEVARTQDELTPLPVPSIVATPAAETLSSEQVAGVSANTLRDATTNTLAQNDTVEATPSAGAAQGSRVISRPNLLEEIELQERAKAQGIELPTEQESTIGLATGNGSTEATGLIAKLSTMGKSVLEKLVAADGTTWLVIAGLLALPAALLGIFSVSKRIEQTKLQTNSAPAMDPIAEPGMQTRLVRQEREAAELFGDDSLNDASGSEAFGYAENRLDKQIDKQFDEQINNHDETNADIAHDAPTRLVAKAVRPTQPKTYSPVDPTTQADIDSAITSSVNENPGWQSAFGSWLMEQPKQDHQEYCVEFLIYWIAYGDERYPTSLRKQLFTATELEPHDQIKRWVLKQDVLAFADVISWLTKNASVKQLDQCIALLMALLVTENNITPVQNTMLRFLSDVFNTGTSRLEMQFSKSFGHALPPVPRPDSIGWWNKQHEDATLRWDARTMTKQPEQMQMMVRLGLTDGYDEADIMQAFMRAARRCNPERFSELGERERALAEQQHVKFEQARDKLLGVLV